MAHELSELRTKMADMQREKRDIEQRLSHFELTQRF